MVENLGMGNYFPCILSYFSLGLYSRFCLSMLLI